MISAKHQGAQSKKWEILTQGKLTATFGTTEREIARKKKTKKQTNSDKIGQDGAVPGDGTDDAHRISLFSAVFFSICVVLVQFQRPRKQVKTEHLTVRTTRATDAHFSFFSTRDCCAPTRVTWAQVS